MSDIPEMGEIVTRWGIALGLAFATPLSLTAQAQDTPARPASPKDSMSATQSSEAGLATIYDAALEGQLTASGEPYRAEDLTAAHRSYPIGTRLRVIAARSGKTVTVRVNDRWGGGGGRVINLSARAARELGFGSARMIEVRIEVDELGTGRSAKRAAPAAPAAVSSAAIADGPPKRASSSAECADQAKILGLEGDWAERHVRACLANRPKK
jgi:rare lipoprotein A (peptidoglycan hydrolase)